MGAEGAPAGDAPAGTQAGEGTGSEDVPAVTDDNDIPSDGNTSVAEAVSEEPSPADTPSVDIPSGDSPFEDSLSNDGDNPSQEPDSSEEGTGEPDEGGSENVLCFEWQGEE